MMHFKHRFKVLIVLIKKVFSLFYSVQNTTQKVWYELCMATS